MLNIYDKRYNYEYDEELGDWFPDEDDWTEYLGPLKGSEIKAMLTQNSDGIAPIDELGRQWCADYFCTLVDGREYLIARTSEGYVSPVNYEQYLEES